MVFTNDSSVLVGEVVPALFRDLASEFHELINVIGSGIRFSFNKMPPTNQISILVNGSAQPGGVNEEGMFTIVIEVDGTYIQTEANLKPHDVVAFCLSYATAYQEKLGGVGPA